MTEPTVREKIRFVLEDKELTSSQICNLTKLDSKIVSTALSAMKVRSKELIYTKYKGAAFGRYKLNKKQTLEKINITNINLKLYQLNNMKEFLRLKGISMIDDIIDDYVLLRKNF